MNAEDANIRIQINPGLYSQGGKLQLREADKRLFDYLKGDDLLPSPRMTIRRLNLTVHCKNSRENLGVISQKY